MTIALTVHSVSTTSLKYIEGLSCLDVEEALHMPQCSVCSKADRTPDDILWGGGEVHS